MQLTLGATHRPPQQPGPGSPPPPSLFAATMRPSGVTAPPALPPSAHSFNAWSGAQAVAMPEGEVMTLGMHGRRGNRLLFPIGGAAVGALLFGLPGAVAGGVLGYLITC